MKDNKSGVARLINDFGLPPLTDEQKAKVREYHEYHGDRRADIVGAIPNDGVFVRIKDKSGVPFSVIDMFDYDGDCVEFDSVEEATDNEEIDLIRKYLGDYPITQHDEYADDMYDGDIEELLDGLPQVQDMPAIDYSKYYKDEKR